MDTFDMIVDTWDSRLKTKPVFNNVEGILSLIRFNSGQD